MSKSGSTEKKWTQDRSKQMKKIIFLILVFSLCWACAPAPWTRRDSLVEASYQVLHFTDMSQSLTISRNRDRYCELNPILGHHPNSEAVYSYFVLTAIGHAALGYFLPRPYREFWQGITIGIEAETIYRNGINYKIGFSW